MVHCLESECFQADLIHTGIIIQKHHFHINFDCGIIRLRILAPSGNFHYCIASFTEFASQEGISNEGMTKGDSKLFAYYSQTCASGGVEFALVKESRGK